MKANIQALSFAASLLLSATSLAGDTLYTAKAAIEYKAAAGTDAEKILTSNLPRGDQSVSLAPVPKTQVFEILVSAPGAKAAATRANQVALSLQSLLNDPNGTEKTVTVWMKASEADAVAHAAVEKTDDDWTPWMDMAQMGAFMAALDGDKPGGKNYWDRGHWITAVEGRWQDGKPEHRIRYAPTPKGKKAVTWYWWLNANQEEWAGHVEKYADSGFTLNHFSSYQRPDGRTIYDGVWHKVVE